MSKLFFFTFSLIFSLIKPENLQELVKFVTEDPPTDAEDAVRFK